MKRTYRETKTGQKVLLIQTDNFYIRSRWSRMFNNYQADIELRKMAGTPIIAFGEASSLKKAIINCIKNARIFKDALNKVLK